MRWILLALLVILSTSTFAQQTFTYSYVDPCSKQLKTLLVPANSSVTVNYMGNIGTFTQSDFQSGVFGQWVSTVQTSIGSQPCDELLTQTQVGQNMIITQNIISTLTAVTASAAMTSASSMSSALGNSVSNSNDGSGSNGGGRKGRNSNRGSDQSGSNTQTNTSGNGSVASNPNGSGQSGSGQNTGQGSGSQSTTGQGGTTTGNPQSSQSSSQGNTTSSNGSNQNQTGQGGSSSGNSTSSEQQGTGTSGQNGQSSSGGANTQSNTGTQGQGNTSTQSTNQGSSGTGTGSEPQGQNQSGSNTSGTNPPNTSSPTSTSNGSNGQGSPTSGQGGSGQTPGQNTQTGSNEQSGGGNGGTTNSISNAAESGGGSGGSKGGGSKVKTGALIGTGDIVAIRSAEDNSNQFKGTISMTKSNTNNTKAKGFLLNFTTQVNNSNLTFYGSFTDKKKKNTLIIANSSMIDLRKNFFNTTTALEAKRFGQFTGMLGLNFTVGGLADEPFSNLSAVGGGFVPFKAGKKVNGTILLLGVYSPYTKFYEGKWWDSGLLLVPFSSWDYTISKNFKYNISFSGTYQLQGNVLQYQILTGGKILL